MKQIIDIFLTFFKIGAFSFGGGYVMLPFIQKEIVELNGWIEEGEFLDIIGISQMTPGPIATNSSTFVGFKVSGILGALFGTIGVILPAFIIALIISRRFEKFKDYKFIKDMFSGLRPGVFGLILSAAVTISKSTITDLRGVIVGLLSFFAIIKFKIHPVVVIIISGVVGMILF